jgi:ATP-dependent RNA helicase DeaD
MKTFDQLGLSAETLKVLTQKGFEVPTPIQEQAIPILLTNEKDIIGQAQTGTGKTAAFGLPILERLKKNARAVQALILTPTRELAVQVAEEIHSLKGKKQVSVIPIYGGQSIDTQLRRLKKGVDIVVGTPGRVIDHLKRRTLKLDQISYLVLDEADEMLNMGFLEDVQEIMASTSKEKQTLLFSATMPSEIVKIAKKYMKDYETIKVTSGGLTVAKTDQLYFEVSNSDKFEALCRIIDIEEEFYGLVFCRTKRDVDDVATHLKDRGYDADALHGDISQAQREKILNKFKRNVINILVATDVAARGIDVQNLTHVINFALPQDSESYVHRIGRTGRAGKEGVAVTFVTPSEYRRLKMIQLKTKTEIRKAKLPNIADIIETKKIRIKMELEEIAHTSLEPAYTDIAGELLLRNAPEDILAALLQYTFEDELSTKGYAQINQRERASVDMKGKTRLFVKKGKRDGLTNKKLINFITNKCSISPSKIKDVLVLDSFSFATLPFHEAEIMLSLFKKAKRGSFPLIVKAKAKK